MIKTSAVYLVTNICDDGRGSLRDSILKCNASTTPSKISFRIGFGSQVIRPLSALPEIVNPVVLDATSQPGFAGLPLVEIDGSQAGPGTNGLVVIAGECTIRGIGIVRFDGYGLRLSGAGGNCVCGNYIGTDGACRTGEGNRAGVEIHSSRNVIGGSSRADTNVISGNRTDGLVISGGGHNLVQGNMIGTDSTGQHAVENGWHGVLILNSPDNLVGGHESGAGNVISGNGRWGVRVAGLESVNNRVRGNLVGTDVSGTTALPNGRSGVLLFNAPSNVVGGHREGEGNVISGNSRQGISIDGSSLRLDFEDSPLTRVAVGHGDCHDNVIAGNKIGTDITGTKAVPNGLHGIVVLMAQRNLIGGSSPGSGNLISGNLKNGVNLLGANPQGRDWHTYMHNSLADMAQDVRDTLPAELNVSGNVVAGNIIGLDASGMLALGNGDSGIAINHAQKNIIGGSEPAAANVISCNGKHGVHVMGATATGNEICGNLIGCNASQSTAPGNGADGVRIHDGSRNRIGGEEASRQNVIVGNKACDVSIHGEMASENTGRNRYTLEGRTALTSAQPRHRIRISKASPATNDIA